MKNFLFILFLISCGHIKDTEQINSDKGTMDRFYLIDHKLEKLAKKLNANILKKGSGYTVNGITVPEEYIDDRRMVWTDGDFTKVVLIQPDFGRDTTNFNMPFWNYLNLAMLANDTSAPKEKPFWQGYFLQKVPLAEIEKNIDQLLRKSVDTLKQIKRENLKTQWSNW